MATAKARRIEKVTREAWGVAIFGSSGRAFLAHANEGRFIGTFRAAQRFTRELREHRLMNCRPVRVRLTMEAIER